MNLDAAVDALRPARRVVVFTGAGMSADSGLATFRDPHDGLWARFRPEELATPQAWQADPALVWAWYQWRLAAVLAAEPHAGHVALARWDAATVVTQNIDDLHERAGSSPLHLHGSIVAPRCADCGRDHPMVVPDPDPVERLTPPYCVCGGLVRPGIVWFGEDVPAYGQAADLVHEADALLVVGTSGLVYPAAGLTDLAVELGRPVVEVNPDSRARPGVVTVAARAVDALPALVDALATPTPRSR